MAYYIAPQECLKNDQALNQTMGGEHNDGATCTKTIATSTRLVGMIGVD